MTLKEVTQICTNEPKARQYFKNLRDKAGVVCKKCASEQHYWLEKRGEYKCKKCGHRTALRSGTLLHATKLHYSEWIMAMYFMTFTKKSISACEVQRQLGRKRYEPVWYMMHKIRTQMGKRDNEYKLTQDTELDEGFIKAFNEDTQDEPRKRGRGSLALSTVLVMAESEGMASPHTHYQKKRKCRYFKMKLIGGASHENIHTEVSKNIDKNTRVRTDGYYAYRKLHQIIKVHEHAICKPQHAHKWLPWVHTAISNLKRALLGTYHGVYQKYLQNYLNEYCYKLNRRYFGDKIFDRLALVSTKFSWCD